MKLIRQHLPTIAILIMLTIGLVLIGCGPQRSSITIDPTTSSAGSRVTEIEYGAPPASVDITLPPSAAEQEIRVTYTNGVFDAKYLTRPVPVPAPAAGTVPVHDDKPGAGPAPK